jgi:hypothetical protein
MKALRTSVGGVLFALAAVMNAGEAAAQQPAHVAGADVLEQAVLEHAADTERSRDRLQALLERDDVREIAAAHAIDADRLHDAAGTLSAAQLARIAPHLQAAESALAGGQVISFNATTLIIILLLIVVVVLIAD